MNTWIKVAAAGLLLTGMVGAAPRNVTIGKGHQASVASDAEGRVHLAYRSGDDICYRQSTDGGRTWTDEVKVAATAEVSMKPTIAVTRTGTVGVAWLEDCRDHSSNDIYIAVSKDAGQTWSAPVDVSHTSGVTDAPALAAGPKGAFHVVWSDTSETHTQPDIFYSYSYNDGQSWVHPLNISRSHGHASGHPALAVGSDGVCHVAWTDSCEDLKHPHIYVTNGREDGWSKPVALNHDQEKSSHPDIAVTAQGRVCVAWLEECDDHSSNDIYYARSDGNGKFHGAIDISRTPGLSSDPSIAADRQGDVVVTWVDTTGHRKAPDVWTARSDTLGRYFTRSANLSHSAGVSHQPHTALVKGKPVVVWTEVWKGTSYLKARTSQ